MNFGTPFSPPNNSSYVQTSMPKSHAPLPHLTLWPHCSLWPMPLWPLGWRPRRSLRVKQSNSLSEKHGEGHSLWLIPVNIITVSSPSVAWRVSVGHFHIGRCGWWFFQASFFLIEIYLSYNVPLVSGVDTSSHHDNWDAVEGRKMLSGKVALHVETGSSTSTIIKPWFQEKANYSQMPVYL